jgi:hypothetical protein
LCQTAGALGISIQHHSFLLDAPSEHSTTL